MVGPPDAGGGQGLQRHDKAEPELYLGKPGLTGLVQLQGDRGLSKEELEQYNLYYAKNQSIALDLEILLKTLLQARRG